MPPLTFARVMPPDVRMPACPATLRACSRLCTTPVFRFPATHAVTAGQAAAVALYVLLALGVAAVIRWRRHTYITHREALCAVTSAYHTWMWLLLGARRRRCSACPRVCRACRTPPPLPAPCLRCTAAAVWHTRNLPAPFTSWIAHP